MPPSRKHHNRIRELVLQSAARLFNRHGFNAVSIDDVMAEAELTLRKLLLLFRIEERFVRAVGRACCLRRQDNQKDGTSERSRADKIVRDYLSAGKHENTGDTFPMIGLPNDISRTDRAVRQAFESAFKLMIRSFEQAAGGSGQARRNNALAIAALCVGGMVLSRSIDDRELANELRGAALTTRSTSGSGERRFY